MVDVTFSSLKKITRKRLRRLLKKISQYGYVYLLCTTMQICIKRAELFIV